MEYERLGGVLEKTQMNHGGPEEGSQAQWAGGMAMTRTQDFTLVLLLFLVPQDICQRLFLSS